MKSNGDHHPSTSNLDAFAKTLLENYGLPCEPLDKVSGWSNHVWLAPEHAVRVSSGRFIGSFAHEKRVISALPDGVPHAPVRFFGRTDGCEWLIQDRLTGEPLRDVWRRLNEVQRRKAGEQLGQAIAAMHETPYPETITNPWIEEALATNGRIENAYHAPPESYMSLINAVAGISGVEHAFLGQVQDFIHARVDAFEGDLYVLVHGDLHFNNLLFDGEHLTAILDFEGARPAPRDQELDTLLRQIREPDLLPAVRHFRNNCARRVDSVC